MEKHSKQFFSMLILVSLLSNYITPTNPFELPPLSPEYFSFAPEIEPPAPQFAQYLSPPAFSPESALDDYPSPPAYAADVAFSPESALDDYLPPQYPSPPPPPHPSTEDELLPAVEASSPAPAMEVLPLSSADEEDAVSAVVTEDSSGEDEVSEYDEHEQGNGGSGGKRNGGAVVGVIIGLCIVGLAGFVLKKKKSHQMRRTQYEYLAKRDEL